MWNRTKLNIFLCVVRVVSTVTTTARSEGMTTLMLLCPHVTVYSEYWSESICLNNASKLSLLYTDLLSCVCIFIFIIYKLMKAAKLINVIVCFSLVFSGMFDDGVHVYTIEPLKQNHSIVSLPFSS